MAEITTIARPYAEAVAKLAGESQAWQAWSAMLAAAAQVAADPQIAALAGNPAIPAERVADVIVSVCGKALNDEGANFVRLLADNKRFNVLPEIAALFEEIKAAQEGTLEARVTTAFELSAAQMSALVAKLEAKFGHKVNASQEVDTSLIGGVVVQVGDEVMDASVRGRLEGMAATLKA
ncbi:F0F1 ATP synthase subunit delta [Parasulfuritortus cantonensis]|uniref:ATP synthase subunit delta n=1 Tax=Parasulfuritortus cantonensis TaxID=2528202 RepID=A0A4R1B3T4_9PROT|nr:F0F1 ATP synthase subunit delta [Parasulfuritortus cantonensis]TCJ12734.1 F0F1 ATP synthase subunit delta [Parasulfuritortus cantonensis]